LALAMRTDPILADFDRAVRSDGAATLVAAGARHASRADVDGAARAVQAGLRDSGALRGTYVLVAAVNGAGFLAALLGVRREGFVPVFADWTSPAAERRRIAEALGIATVVACDEAVPGHPGALRVETTGFESADPPAGCDYVKLTSGSSGAPSGVAVSVEAIAADDEQLAVSMGVGRTDRLLAVIPWSHSYGLTSLVTPALRRGAVLVLPVDGGPWAPLDAAAAGAATVFPTVPVYLETLVALAEAPAWPASLRTVISAGAPLSPATAARFRGRFGLPVHVFYGASECGGIAYDREGAAAERGTVGTAIQGVTIALEGPDAPHAGTVVVRSPATALARVPASSERLSGGVFVSADVAAWTDDGELRLTGRADALINVAGKKVQPAEIEGILRGLPGVRDVVVLGVRSAVGAREVVRAVIACDRSVLDYATVTRWCRLHLASHKIPRSIVFVDEIPRTSRGKVDRVALAGPEPARVPR